jgi:hypothetical protein
MKKQTQKGFGAIVIILVVVGLIAVGFVGWRLYEGSKRTSAEQSQQNNSTGQQTQNDPNTGYIVIKAWGVRFKPVNSLSDLIYDTDDAATPSQTRFSIKALAQYGGTCGTGSDSRSPLGMLTRTTTPKEEFVADSGAFVKHIGSYYYQYVTPQTACADNNTTANNLQIQTTALFKSSILTLEAAK